MKYAVIAAGQGSRLVSDGISVSKPLLEVNGEPLLQRLIALFMRHNAESIALIINEEMDDVKEFVAELLAQENEVVISMMPQDAEEEAE